MLRSSWVALGLSLLVGGVGSAQDLGPYDVNDYSGGFAEGSYSPIGDEQLYPYDAQDQWQHGYIQYMPFYGAYKHFRPYNYKHVSAQTQASAGVGMSPRMPYSQQFWHRYHSHAKMGHPASGAYESYQDVPVPQRREMNPGQNQYQPNQPLQRTPQPEQAPAPQGGPMQLLPPTNNGPTNNGDANSVRFTPAPQPNYAGVSFQPGYPAAPQMPMPAQTMPNGYGYPGVIDYSSTMQPTYNGAAPSRYAPGPISQGVPSGQQPLLIVP